MTSPAGLRRIARSGNDNIPQEEARCDYQKMQKRRVYFFSAGVRVKGSEQEERTKKQAIIIKEKVPCKFFSLDSFINSCGMLSLFFIKDVRGYPVNSSRFPCFNRPVKGAGISYGEHHHV